MTRSPQLSTTVCVIGGGPAGVVAGMLLARQGVGAVVLEKHPDFLRDFRGDTIHPSTQELIYELGWIEEFHRIPHSRMHQVTVAVGDKAVTLADFRKLKVHSPYVAFMPQLDFLDFLVGKAQQFPGFPAAHPRGDDRAADRRRPGGRRPGGHADGPLEVRADLVVAADGRHSRARAHSGLTTTVGSRPMDVLWFRTSRRPTDDLAFFRRGKGAMVTIDRGDYWQIADTFPPAPTLSCSGPDSPQFHDRIGALAPALRDRTDEVDRWDKVHHLTVRVDRLITWHRPGLLCIGDAAHAMSPAGGVGINLAIQDAVAAANTLGSRLRRGTLRDSDLPRVQKRRETPTKITQAFQLAILRDLYTKHLDDDTAAHQPPIFTAFRALPPLRHIVGRFIGLGIRREHIRAKAAVTPPPTDAGPAASSTRTDSSPRTGGRWRSI